MVSTSSPTAVIVAESPSLKVTGLIASIVGASLTETTVAVMSCVSESSPSLTPIVMVSTPNQFSKGSSVILEPTTLQAILSEATQV